jgi:hypothetical protein
LYEKEIRQQIDRDIVHVRGRIQGDALVRELKPLVTPASPNIILGEIPTVRKILRMAAERRE